MGGGGTTGGEEGEDEVEDEGEDEGEDEEEEEGDIVGRLRRMFVHCFAALRRSTDIGHRMSYTAYCTDILATDNARRFAMGTTVRVEGTSREDLNGETGWVVSPLDPSTGRCGIVLPKWSDPSENGKTQLEFGDLPSVFALKPEKLIRVEDGNGT